MTLDPAALRAFVGATEKDSAFVTECVAEADALIAKRVGDAPIPAPVRDRAVKEVAADLFYRRSARNGVAAFGGGGEGGGGEVVRLNRNPLAPAEPILAPFLGPRLA